MSAQKSRFVQWVGLLGMIGACTSESEGSGGQLDLGPPYGNDTTGFMQQSSSTGFGQSVLGTKHDGLCHTKEAFLNQCKSEGGTPVGECTYALCTGGWVCLPSDPAPAGKFKCGTAVCDDTQVCTITDPRTDGCPRYECRSPPAACEGDPACACLGDFSMVAPVGALLEGVDCSDRGGFLAVTFDATF